MHSNRFRIHLTWIVLTGGFAVGTLLMRNWIEDYVFAKGNNGEVETSRLTEFAFASLVLAFASASAAVGVLGWAIARGFDAKSRYVTLYLVGICAFCLSLFANLNLWKPYLSGFGQWGSRQIDPQAVIEWSSQIESQKRQLVFPIDYPDVLLNLKSPPSMVALYPGRVELVWGNGFAHWGFDVAKVQQGTPDSPSALTPWFGEHHVSPENM